MLQQTPVARVEPVWHEWLDRWPTPSAMAAASHGDVLRAWGKLGYPRRALRLHAAATAIAGRPRRRRARRRGHAAVAARHRRVHRAGRGRVRLPQARVRWSTRTCGGWSRGPCTAPVTPVRPSTTRDMADVEALLPQDDERAALFSAGLMELGQVICTVRTPRCADCPVFDGCAWQRAGRPAYTGPAEGRAEVRRHRPAGARQAAGRAARHAPAPVPRAALDAVWSDDAQRDRCLDSLLVDGLRRADRRRPVRPARRGVRPR